MSTIYAPAIHDLFRGSVAALSPEVSDIDRPRLMRAMRGSDGYRESRIVQYVHRMFDTRWTYGERDDDARECLAVCPSGEAPLVARHAVAALDGPVELFPLTRTNLSDEAMDFVRGRGIAESELFHHAIAVLAARRDGRIPLPEEKKAIQDSALLGYRLASLFTDHDPLVAISPMEQALRVFGVPSRIGKEARMLRGAVLRVDDREHAVTRVYRGDEIVAFADLGGDEALALLGDRTCDVYLNEKALWRNVPSEVWNFTHRGVPLLRAWLSDRRAETLGRGLLRDEVTQFSTTVRRIAQLLLLQPALAKNAEM
ncbi:MAG TPA: type ISP restriction/modification enzyme [Thermoanaerobaculia bacterium]|jgi:hypothetical protein